MKLFSKKKWTALFVSGILALACVGTGVSTLTNQAAFAEDATTYVRPEAENIEDLIDSRSDFYLPRQNDKYDNVDSYWNTGTALVEKRSNSNTNGTPRKSYFYDTKTTDATNVIDYDGNIAVYTEAGTAFDDWVANGATATTLDVAVGIRPKRSVQTAYAKQLNEADTANGTAGNGYGLVSFRTNFSCAAGKLSLGVMVQDNNSYGLANKWSYSGKGYYFAPQNETTCIHYGGNKENWNKHTDNGGKKLPDGTDVIITFGIYKASATQDNLYLKIVDANDGSVYTEIDKAALSGATYADAGTRVFSIMKGAAAQSGTADIKMHISGVNEPILENTYAASFATEAQNAGEEGAALSTVALPEGYAWKDGATVLDSEVKTYKATATGTYYGKTISVETDVAVTVKNTRTTLVFKNGETEVLKKSLKKGENFDYSEIAWTDGTLLGWANADKLYQPNYNFTATAEEATTIEYTAVALDFKMINGASIRLAYDENTYGGLRFVAAFASTDWASVQAYLTGAYGVIVPVDDETYFNGGFTAAAKALYATEAYSFIGKTAYGYETLKLTEAEAGGYDLFTFALTNIQYKNYNRVFASAAFVSVEYADGSSADFQTAYAAENNSRSVYEVASAAYAHHTSVVGGVYSEAQLKVIEKYIVNVLDLEYTASTNTLTLINRAEDDLVRPYTLSSASVADVITIVLTNVAADSLLATSTAAPANVSGIPGTNGVVRYVGTVSYDAATQTATITASMN